MYKEGKPASHPQLEWMRQGSGRDRYKRKTQEMPKPRGKKKKKYVVSETKHKSQDEIDNDAK